MALFCIQEDPARREWDYVMDVTTALDCDVRDMNMFIAVPVADYDTLDNVHTETIPITAAEVVEAVGAGFFVALPLMLIIFGGRAVLSMLFKPN